MAAQTHRQIDLFAKLPWLKKLVKLRGFQFWIIFPNLIIFLFFFIAGIFGSPVGSSNIMIIWIWILWWFLLISIMVPFLGRIWCTVCPLPFFSDWLQRRALIKVRSGKMSGGILNKLYGLNRRWPKKFANIWIQNLFFLCLATISALLVTRPIVTVIVLGGIMVLSTVLALIYRMRSFCNYVCPVSGFLSLYSMTAMTALRSKDLQVCQECKDKSCLRGSDKGWACPWFVYMGKTERNNYCGLCMECVKSCPNDNITLYARPFSVDMKLKGYDEAFKAFIMLALAIVYSVTLLGPWGVVKDWANFPEVGNMAGFGVYALGVWGLSLGVVPGLHTLATWFSRKWAKAVEISWKDYFLRFAYPFVPLGLLAWIAFSIPLVMVNGAYIVSTLSDPMGRGWDLFGTAHIPWTPIFPEYVGYLQAIVLFIGLYFAVKATLKLAEELFSTNGRRIVAALPHLLVQLGITVVLLRFFVG